MSEIDVASVIDTAAWFRDKNFTSDTLTPKLTRWMRHLRRYTTRPSSVLEIGCGDGRFAVFAANYTGEANITAVDSFDPETEARFDANVAEFGGRVTKLAESPVAALDHLIAARARFDCIYLRAGRQRDYVFAASLLAWPLLKNRGIMAWADYEWGEGKPSDKRPHDAINWFIELNEGQVKPLYSGNEMVVEKIRPE